MLSVYTRKGEGLSYVSISKRIYIHVFLVELGIMLYYGCDGGYMHNIMRDDDSYKLISKIIDVCI